MTTITRIEIGNKMSEKILNNRPVSTLVERQKHIAESRRGRRVDLACDRHSLAGAVSQRACVYSGARVVLNPIVDAVHLVHGPIGCAAYTWDIRGSLSSGPQTYQQSFSTDLREKDVIFGAENKLYKAVCELIKQYRPPAVFVYATCAVGIIGDDIKAVCRVAEKETGCLVIPVQSEGFRGNKREGYKAACHALLDLIGRDYGPGFTKNSGYRINILGEFNVAGDLWEVSRALSEMGIAINASVTGDGRVERIANAHNAQLNLVQCSGSLAYLARQMEIRYEIPFIQVSFFGPEDFSDVLIKVADFFDDRRLKLAACSIAGRGAALVLSEIEGYRRHLEGKTAAIYMGGPAKTLALIRAFKSLGMRVAVAGTQSGKKDDYARLVAELDQGAIVIDDANPLELAQLLRSQNVDLMVGGVKERYLAYKLGVAFCDFNHDRTTLFAGYQGFLNFVKEVHDSIFAPVWQIARGGEILRCAQNDRPRGHSEKQSDEESSGLKRTH